MHGGRGEGPERASESAGLTHTLEMCPWPLALAGERGTAHASYNLAVYYLTGRNVAADVEKAMELFARAQARDPRLVAPDREIALGATDSGLGWLFFSVGAVLFALTHRVRDVWQRPSCVWGVCVPATMP